MDTLSSILFNVVSKKVIRDVELNARDTILFKFPQLRAYASDIKHQNRK